MGKKSPPAPPPPPDPEEIAAAEARYNRIDQYTPYGNLVYSGPERNIATLSLSPEMQGIFDQQLVSDRNMINMALERQGMLDPNPIDLSQFGNIRSDIDLSRINFEGFNPTGLQGLLSPELQRLGASPQLQQSIGTFGVPQLGQLQRADGLPALTGTVNPADVPDARTGAGITEFERDITNLGSAVRPGDIPSYRGDVEQAFFDRQRALLDPVLSDQQRAMQQRLANRGLPESGEAYNRDTTRFLDARNRAFTDLARNAVLAGGSEASRQVGDMLAARGQGFGEALAGGQFRLGAAGTDFEKELARSNFALGQNMGIANFGNTAAQQNFANQLQQAGFNNAADFQRFGAGLQGAQFGLGQNLAAGQFGNAALQQQYANALSQTGFNNQSALQQLMANQGIREQQFGEQAQANALNNQASAQNLALQQQLLNNANQARAQSLAEQQGIRSNQFNELAALLGLDQIQPQRLNDFYAPANANVLGAYQLNQDAQQYAHQVRAQNQSDMLGGLFGLGAAAIGGPFGGALGGMLFGDPKTS